MSGSSTPTSDYREAPEAHQERADTQGWVDEEEDDDDMDYEPTSGASEDLEPFDPEDDDAEFLDANEDFNDLEFEFTVETGNGNDEGEETETDMPRNPDGPAGAARTTRSTPDYDDGSLTADFDPVSSAQIIQLLGATGLHQILESRGLLGSRSRRVDDDDDDDLQEGYGGLGSRRRRKSKAVENNYPEVPSEEGRKLMDSGIYGNHDHFRDTRQQRKKNLATRLMYRELGVDTRGTQDVSNMLMAQNMIPSSKADKIIHYNSRCYSGQFSDDGNFFFTCSQDFKVRMYDTSNPYDWKHYKTVDYPWGQWTITDASLSPDNRYLAYSSIRHMVCLAPTDPSDHSEPMTLDFSNMSRNASRRSFLGGNTSFGIWSIRFSGDGREIVAGTGDRSVVVYDLETRQSILQLQNHDDDVNAVCYGDQSSPHILYSGSDDSTLRVWDRRSMGDGREAGVFIGHTEGLTYVDSKGDGRYVLSNGKDQLMKLWDLRKMMSSQQFDRIDPSKYTTGFDYRFMPYAEDEYQRHPHDCSVVTFRGHRVLKTLIRCHFSPPGSTNSKYVYTGSEDGNVHIYNLDATLAGKVNVAEATRGSRPRHPDIFTSSYEMGSRGHSAWKTCVRDASWHPNAPIIAATSWNGWGMATGTCTVHSWNDGNDDDEGDPPMSTKVNARLQWDPEYSGPRPEGVEENPRGPERLQSMRRGLRSRRVMMMDDDGDGW